MLRYLSALTLLLYSCSSPSPDNAPPDAAKLGELIPPELRAKPRDRDAKEFAPVVLPGDKPADVKTGSRGATVLSPNGIPTILPALPDASDMVWTDPDNPDENLGSLEAVFTQPVKDPWQLSFRSALRKAYTEGKPLMIWFTDSKSSPTCKILGAELFGTDQFMSWSDEQVVRLRVDTNPREADPILRTSKNKYALALRKKFRVKGNPTVLVIGHSGETVGRYTGYRSGNANYRFGQIKNATNTINEGHFNWRDSMDKKGYRHWTGHNGVKLYAKLLRYQDGTLYVSEPNGRKTRFHEKNLSTKDRKWIDKEKAKREA